MITPLLIRNIENEIQEKQNETLVNMTSQHLTESELVSLRSPFMERTSLWNGVQWKISKNEKVKFEKNGFHEPRDMAEQLTYVFMEELVKGGEIFFFNPCYKNPYRLCWIRY